VLLIPELGTAGRQEGEFILKVLTIDPVLQVTQPVPLLNAFDSRQRFHRHPELGCGAPGELWGIRLGTTL
jgi:hypothetical protein